MVRVLRPHDTFYTRLLWLAIHSAVLPGDLAQASYIHEMLPIAASLLFQHSLVVQRNVQRCELLRAHIAGQGAM